MAFKPLLASPVDLDKLKFPVLASVKLDGIRAIVIDGVVMSRKLKPIPNLYVQSLFKDYEYLDGELICGDPYSPSCYRDTSSGCMAKAGEPDVRFYVFDCIRDPNATFTTRYTQASRIVASTVNCNMVGQTTVSNMDELLRFETQQLDLGAEGIMLRSPDGFYKMGRSTAKEAILTKLKRFSDSEFEVVGYEERMHNGNEATTDALGNTKRSSHKENKSGRGDLGALILKHGDSTFNCGSGFNDAERALLWEQRESLAGRIAKVKHFECGAKDMPRFPTFLGFRDSIDMDERNT